jgi:HrpA-like RNA helicase
MRALPELPVSHVLAGVGDALATSGRAVLSAPPGAGKTTHVPLYQLDQAWRGDGKIILLEPRRLAARAAASRMASLLGEQVGETVGYRMRLDNRVSARTRSKTSRWIANGRNIGCTAIGCSSPRTRMCRSISSRRSAACFFRTATART